VDGLAEFWEAEVPRVGEADALGWAAWEASGRKDYTPRCIPLVAENDVTDLDPYRQWAAKESQADRTGLLPTRSSDEGEDVDPYSTILFSDIQPLLSELRSFRGKYAFRLAWLSVLGLHIPGFSDSLSANELNWDDRWNYSHLTRSSYLAALFPGEMMRKQLSTEAVAGVIVGREKEHISGFGPVRCWGSEVFGPLDGVEVEGLGDRDGRTGIWGKDDVSGLDEELVRRVFAQLRQETNDFEWDVLSLAFEAALSAKRYGPRFSTARRNCFSYTLC
jgi:NRDE-2, necessary for RNA interference